MEIVKYNCGEDEIIIDSDKLIKDLTQLGYTVDQIALILASISCFVGKENIEASK